MRTSAEDENQLETARELARSNQLFVVEVSDRVRGVYRRGWVVYRKLGEDCRPARLGRRRDPEKLLRFVQQLIAPPARPT